MYIANVTNDYDNISSSKYTDYDNVTSGNDNITLSNCTFNENDIDEIIPSLLSTIPCGSIIFMFNEFDGIHFN